MEPLFLGLDIGTSSAKGTLVDGAGTVRAQARAEYAFESAAPGRAEQDPQTWVEAARRLVHDLAAQADTSRIAAIGVAAQMRGVILLGADLKPVRKSLLWNDTRCTSEVTEALAAAGALLRQITVNPLNTMASLPKFLWLMRHEPDTWRATRAIVFPKDFLVLALTGALQTDFSDASGSSVFDLRAGHWSAEILDRFAIDPAKLPPVRRSSDIVGTVGAAASQRFGLKRGIPVIAGGSDSTLDSYAAGLAPGEVKIRLGTSGAVSWLVSDPDEIDSDKVYCWNYVTPGLFLADINTRSCAQSVDWFCRLAYRECPTSESAYRALQDEAATIAPGADGLVFRPHLQGEDAPFWDAGMTASFTGLNAAHSRAHMARAVLEGTAFALADALSVTGRDAPRRARLVGGGTRNPVWTRILRDVIGYQTISSPDRDTAFGAALLAAAGTGQAVMGGAADAVLAAPDPALHARYRDLLAVYRQRLTSAITRENDR